MSEKNLQELVARSSRSSKSLAAAAPGVSPTKLSAAERYEVQPYYRRFEQKMNMTQQPLWRPEAMELAKEMAMNRLRLVQGRIGYKLSFAGSHDSKRTIIDVDKCPSRWRTILTLAANVL